MALALLKVTQEVPVGTVSPFAGASAPSGYLLCNGQAVSRAIYASLFAAIGVSHGSGDGSTTFNLPDYRGRFLRGVAGGQATDPDRGSRTAMNTGGNTGDSVGSVQGQATAANGLSISGAGAHQHTGRGNTSDGAYPPSGGQTGLATDSGVGINANNSGVGGSRVRPTTLAYDGVSDHTHTIGGNSETRPVNAYVNYIIKY